MEKTVGRCHVAVEWGGGVYEQVGVDAWVTVAICGLKFIRLCQNDSKYAGLDNKIIWLKFSGSLSPHPDRD